MSFLYHSLKKIVFFPIRMRELRFRHVYLRLSGCIILHLSIKSNLSIILRNAMIFRVLLQFLSYPVLHLILKCL